MSAVGSSCTPDWAAYDSACTTTVAAAADTASAPLATSAVTTPAAPSRSLVRRGGAAADVEGDVEVDVEGDVEGEGDGDVRMTILRVGHPLRSVGGGRKDVAGTDGPGDANHG